MNVARRSGYRSERSLKDSVVVVSGASRGIGREIAVRAGADGARVVLLAKTETANPKIAGTLPETAEAVRAAGGDALAVACDVRDADGVAAAVLSAEGVQTFDEYRLAEREEDLTQNFYLPGVALPSLRDSR